MVSLPKRRGIRAAVTVACAISVGMSGCGGGGTTSRTSANPAGGSSGSTGASGSSTPLPTYTEAPASMAGDRTVQIEPVTYDPGGPCASVARTVPRTVVPAACQTQWLGMDSVYVPGQDLMNTGYPTGTPMPKSASVSNAVSPADGAAAVTAYFRLEAFSTWALPYTDRTVVATLDTLRYAPRDPVLGIWNRGGYIGAIPACGYATSFRVVQTDTATQEYFSEQGWPQASKTAVVATFPACPGTNVTYRNAAGGSKTSLEFGQGHAGSAIATGFIQDIAPFGKIWVVDGYEPCGPAQLKAICG